MRGQGRVTVPLQRRQTCWRADSLQEQPFWVPHAPVVRHSSEAVAKLLAAAETRRSGASIKSLCLAAHVTAKKATFALTVQTLRCGRPHH